MIKQQTIENDALVMNSKGEVLVNLDDEITPESTKEIMSQLKTLEMMTEEILLANQHVSKQLQEEIPTLRIVISSPGGSLYHTFTICNEIFRLKELGVYTIAEVNAYAMSGAFFVLMSCDHRTVTSDFMVELLYHTTQCALPFGCGNEHIRNLGRYNKMLDKFKELIIKETKVTREMLNEYEEKDWFIDLQTARELEIINDQVEEEEDDGEVEIKLSDMIRELTQSGYKVVNDLEEPKETVKEEIEEDEEDLDEETEYEEYEEDEIEEEKQEEVKTEYKPAKKVKKIKHYK